MRLEIDDRARSELAEAVGWYEEQRAGLGNELWDEVQLALQRILEAPLSFVVHPRILDVRRLPLRRFPFWIVFAVRADIRVLAFAHMSRAPDYWLGRR